MEQMFPVFSTKNLTFGPVTYHDASDIFKLFSDPETMSLDGGQTMKSMEEAFEFVRFYSVYQPHFPILRRAVRSKVTGEFYGTGGFYKIDAKNQKAEIGGELLKDHWKKGIASEALAGFISYGFDVLNFNRITAMISTKNKSANRLINKSPFKYEGCLRQWEKWGDKWMDINVYSLLREERPLT